jgi:hypothetical protein
MKNVERPEVESATGKIDASRRGGGNHAAESISFGQKI